VPTDDLSAPDAAGYKLAERLANGILAAQAEQHDGTNALGLLFPTPTGQPVQGLLGDPAVDPGCGEA